MVWWVGFLFFGVGGCGSVGFWLCYAVFGLLVCVCVFGVLSVCVGVVGGFGWFACGGVGGGCVLYLVCFVEVWVVLRCAFVCCCFWCWYG